MFHTNTLKAIKKRLFEVFMRNKKTILFLIAVILVSVSIGIIYATLYNTMIIKGKVGVLQ